MCELTVHSMKSMGYGKIRVRSRTLLRRLRHLDFSFNNKEILLSEQLSFRPRRFDGGGMRYLRFTNWLTELDQLAGPIATIWFEEAHVLVSKYADHLPLYRQAQIYSRQGIDLDRSTLAAWVGKSAFELTPVYEALMADLKRSTKLFMDETPAPVLAPGRKKTKTGYFWALARDDRPWGGDDPPGEALKYIAKYWDVLCDGRIELDNNAVDTPSAPSR